LYSNGFNTQCENGRDGKVLSSVTGGQNYNVIYSWKSGDGQGIVQGAKRQSNLSSGTYMVEAQDHYKYYLEVNKIVYEKDSFCLARDTITLKSPPPLEIFPQLSNYKGFEIDCPKSNTGFIKIDSIKGGFGSYSYSWQSSSGSVTAPFNKDQVDLKAGTYNLTVTYGALCNISYAYALHEPSVIILDSALSNYKGSNISCFGFNDGFIKINPNGSVGSASNYKYLWSTVDGLGLETDLQNQKDLTAGTYHLKITDNNSCEFDWDISLSQPKKLKINTVTENIKCSGDGSGRIEAIVESGTGTPEYSFSWDTGETTSVITNVSIRDYKVIVTDGNNCRDSVITHVSAPDPLTIDISKKNISCYGKNDGSVSIQILGGRSPYTYAWSNGSTTATIDGLSKGAYSVEVTDWGGCKGTLGTTIKEPDSLIVSYTKKDLTCFNKPEGSIELFPTGGTPPYEYVWWNGITDQSSSSLYDGEYLIVVRDSNYCSFNLAITLTKPDTIVVEKSTVKPFCPDSEDGSITVNASGGTGILLYSWYDGSGLNTIENLKEGLYKLTITDGNNCQVTDTTHLKAERSACVDIPSAISPNGDGVNDTWDIQTGSKQSTGGRLGDMYPNAIIEIYNRWGILVFKSQAGYPVDWDGNYNGSKLPIDSYHYILDLRNGRKPLTGIVTIIR